ncbi:hypothetical protein QYF36_018491 [Acer negundo]|nr:hypothetical protein QYF36_018491 [Acer negundo]
MFSLQKLVESGCYKSVPSEYVFETNPDDDCTIPVTDVETIPTIDFSLLTSGSPEQRSNAIQAIGNASKTVRDEMLRASNSFFKQSEEQMKEYAGKKVSDPTRCGTSFNPAVEKKFLWRDYLKLNVHPNFNSPQNPPGFSEILQEYCKGSRELAVELLEGISESLGLEGSYLEKTMDLESNCHKFFVINLYPPCPQPELAMGLPPHSDHGLLIILMQNDL